MKKYNPQSGNILAYILIGIVLIGLLTIAVRGTSPGSKLIDNEDATIKAAQIARFGQQVEEGVARLLANGVSEQNIRFAHPLMHTDYGVLNTSPTQQVFHPSGGGVFFQSPPSSIFVSGNPVTYDFYATTAIPDVGSNQADLVLNARFVTKSFCDAVNKAQGLDIITLYPEDPAAGTPSCIYGGTSWKYSATNRINATPNTFDTTSFSRKPVTQACVRCPAGGGNWIYNYFYVLLAR